MVGKIKIAPARIAGIKVEQKKMKNIDKLEGAARRAHYAPSTASGNWEAEKSDGTGTSGLKKREFGV